MFYLEKRRDTFHFRGALKRLGMKFDGEKRLWYAETQEVLNAALKMLADEAEPPMLGGQQQGQDQPKQGEQQGQQGQGKGGQQQEGQGEGSGEAEGSGEQGEGQGSGSGQGDGPPPFATFTQHGAQAADKALAQMLQQGKQEQQKQQKQQQQMQQQVQQEVAKAKAELEALVKAQEPKEVHVQVGDAPALTLEGTEYVPLLEQIAALLQCGKHVRLVGPAGTGKSFMAAQVAKILGLRFGFINGSEGIDEAHLYGFRDITAEGTKYVVPELCFADLYENGGLWLGDEFDRMNPNVTVSLNGSLSEPFMLSLPKRAGKTMAQKHPDFKCIVTMNTWGTGPNAAYTSANRLDASSLDRFRISTLYVDYNRKLEAQLMPDAELLRKIWKIRDTVMALGLQRVVSTRFVKDAADCVARLNWSHEAVIGQLVLDWSQTDKQKVGA